MPGVNSPKVPFENSPGFVLPGFPGHALEGGTANRLTDASPVGGKGGRGDQTWGTRHDPGIASAGCLGIRDCPPTRNRSQDRAHAHCQRPNGAGLYAEAAAGASD